MAQPKHPITVTHVEMGDAVFHILQMPTKVRTGMQIAATLEVTGPGGSFGRGGETTYQYLITVSQGGRTGPLEAWTRAQFQQFVSRATGIAEQNVHDRRTAEEDED